MGQDEDKKIKIPTDPTADFEEMINDASGLTGITTNDGDENKNARDHDVAHVKDSSDYRNQVNEEAGFSTSNPDKTTNKMTDLGTSQNLHDDATNQNETLKEAYSPAVEGEQSISGDMPDPSSDDDVLQNAQNMGVAVGEDTEHPQTLDIAGDMDKAEEYQRTH